MSIDSSIANELVTSGPPAVKFPTIGEKVRLRIQSVTKSQETDYDEGTPLTYSDGNPRWQFIFAGINVDTGDECRLFAKGGMLFAIKEAFRAANAKPEVDGELVVKFSETKPSSNPKYNDIKVFQAKYTAPAPVANLDEL